MSMTDMLKLSDKEDECSNGQKAGRRWKYG